jgi:hypothetical protein
MIRRLCDEERRALARLAAMMTCGAALVLPLTAQTSSAAGAQDVQAAAMDRFALTVPRKLTFPTYSVSRDPFVPGVAHTTVVTGTGAGYNGEQTAVPIVRGIVVGDPERALVEIGGVVRVVGVGDRVGDATIENISSVGVVLSDGTQLHLEGSGN